MSYSTPEELRNFVDRPAVAGARSALQWGGTGTGQDDQIQKALSAAFNDLNAAAEAGGYAIPITESGLGVTPEVFEGVLAWLQLCEIAIAYQTNLFPIDTTAKMKAAFQLCEDRLEMLRAGTALPSGTQRAGGTFEYVTTTGVPVVSFTEINSPLRVPPL